MKDYPVEATERFDDAKFHRKYCMSFVKKFIHGNVLEVGAGCGSFTRDYIDDKMNATLTETDNKNFEDLKKNFINNKNIKISNKTIFEIEDKFDTILYLHVLEHIKDDRKELKEIETKLNKGGHLIIMVPRHQKLYSNFDKSIGHFRRYRKNFFINYGKKNKIKLVKIIYFDSMGFLFVCLNRLINSKKKSSVNIGTFIWNLCIPISRFLDKVLGFSIGKSILCIYKK